MRFLMDFMSGVSYFINQAISEKQYRGVKEFNFEAPLTRLLQTAAEILGLSVGAINLPVRNGRLHRLYRGVFAVGHAHIDSAWLWPLRETRRKCARTFASTVTLMDQYPEHRFACSQAAAMPAPTPMPIGSKGLRSIRRTSMYSTPRSRSACSGRSPGKITRLGRMVP